MSSIKIARSAIRSTLRASGRAPLRASRSVIHGTSMKFGAAFPSALRRCYSTGSTIQEEIANQIKQAKVVIYMKGSPNAPACGFSRTTVDVLKREGAEFAAYNVLESDDLRNGIKEFTSWPTIPQVFIDGEFVGGCDIIVSMHREGELTPLLKKAGAIPSAR